MKFPFSTPQNHPSSDTKPLTYTSFANITPQFGYEPTSVLDLRRSPSPVVNISESVTGISGIVSDVYPLHWDDEHILHHASLLSDDWDSMVLDLTEKDDDYTRVVTNSSDIAPFHNQNHGINFNFDHRPSNDFFESDQEFDCSQLDQLIRAVESNKPQLAQSLLVRFNQRLCSPSGKPLQRAAFYFKEALQIFLNGSHYENSKDVIQKIIAYKEFSEISPIPHFANFTANQALLDGLDGAMIIHVIDFDIGIGGQWVSFIQELANKAKSRKSLPTALRISAVVPEDYTTEASLVRESLQQFARELGVQFHIEFVVFSIFEVQLFNSIRFGNGESVGVNLSPEIFRRLKSLDTVSGFFRFLRRISPRIITFVDTEGWRYNNNNNNEDSNTSFRRNFINGLEFYSAILESLDVAGNVDLVRRIEKFLIRPKIIGTALGPGNHIFTWREMLSRTGLLPVRLSGVTESDALWLVRRSQVRGFHLAKHEGLLVLSWHEKEVVATSAWSCSVGVVLPVLNTFEAIQKKDPNEQHKWLLYWAAYGSFSVAESFAEKALSGYSAFHT
ncbi:hypothetical protein GIB67_017445 [Kingdonia uniflora]|uniref:Uncharacterized protein n=1 Tax=Kingdonia uniflora TaxID=39325 RepID=A0A7J7M4D6_9MAGN|nr:hypothetical protein GIB67_017445 [Kingdonia uniflora]